MLPANIPAASSGFHFLILDHRRKSLFVEASLSTNTLTVDQSFVLPTASTEQVVLPFLDLKAQFADIREEVLRAVENVLENQHFILGKEVDKLETEVAQLVGCRLAIGCASGSDALFLSL